MLTVGQSQNPLVNTHRRNVGSFHLWEDKSKILGTDGAGTSEIFA